MSFLFGGSKSRTSSKDISANISESMGSSYSGGRSSQSIAFNDIFRNLYSNAASKALDPRNANPAQQLFSGGLKFLSELTENSGIKGLENIISGSDNALENNLGALQSSLGRFFSEELNPAITSDAVATGSLGGGRQGVAQGIASRGVAEQFSQGAASLINANQQRTDSASTSLAQLMQQGSSLGLDNLGNLLGIGTEAETGLAPLSMLSQILGGPTTLTESEERSRASNYGMSSGFSYGTSTGKSSSFNFGLGS